MWPMTFKLPKYKESYVIVFVDKYCALLEVMSPKYQKIKTDLLKIKFKLLFNAVFKKGADI